MWMCEKDRRVIRIFLSNLREVFQGLGCGINCRSLSGNNSAEPQLLRVPFYKC